MMPWKKEILASAYIHVDETGLKVLLGKEVGTTNKSISIAVTCGVMTSTDKRVFFDYQHGRGEEHTHGILKDYKGIVHTDDGRYTKM